jgi:hypothetical protein
MEVGILFRVQNLFQHHAKAAPEQINRSEQDGGKEEAIRKSEACRFSEREIRVPHFAKINSKSSGYRLSWGRAASCQPVSPSLVFQSAKWCCWRTSIHSAIAVQCGFKYFFNIRFIRNIYIGQGPEFKQAANSFNRCISAHGFADIACRGDFIR